MKKQKLDIRIVEAAPTVTTGGDERALTTTEGAPAATEAGGEV